MMTRQDYMSGKCTHREYYAQFVTPEVTESVLEKIGKPKLLMSSDPHLNDIPLQKWDGINFLSRVDLHGLFRQANDSVTMAGLVCIAKEAARQIIERDRTN